ncbi:unnamed protein product [Danaus chrysippus]|uniref:(African queen) hypothetical protein n=1 Tax=Danaus chrysippus TaxID=151541 RepID=A0A8J2R363_9NEOP|nr:unnamed protein product [Danaus chrysippus]
MESLLILNTTRGIKKTVRFNRTMAGCGRATRDGLSGEGSDEPPLTGERHAHHYVQPRTATPHRLGLNRVYIKSSEGLENMNESG